MKSYLALTAVNLKLALRERIAIFFNYVFPLIFFFAFGQLMHAEQGGAIAQIVTMVLVIGILGNGLFGGGIRAVQDREQNILRRFKVAPISPTPMLAASMVTGWVLYIPALFLIVGLAHLIYGMALPERWLSLFVLVSVAVVAFRSIGLIIASVANSAQESQILVQLVYIPMLFLTGATFSLTMLPSWAQQVAQFLPATYLVNGLQGMILRNESLAENWSAVGALLVTIAISTFISTRLFRWERDEKIHASGKLWLIAVIFPFLLLGSYQAFKGNQVSRTRALYRDMARSRTLLVRGARIFTGDGSIIDSGAILIRKGSIAEIYEGSGPDPASVQAEAIEAAGKTVLPGLIDVKVDLAGRDPVIRRKLAACLYSGVTTVGSARASSAALLDARSRVASGAWLGAELFTSAPSPSPRVFVPALSAIEGKVDAASGNVAALNRSLVGQVVLPSSLRAERMLLEIQKEPPERVEALRNELNAAEKKALLAYRAGDLLVTGTDAGSPIAYPGPALHRELQLLVRIGIPPKAALTAATYNAARVLRADDRIGLIRKGHDADLLIVDGNPLEDIAATERISIVIFKGERIDRGELFDQE